MSVQGNVLVVDDDEPLLITVAEMLSQEGFSVRMACSAPEAIETYAKDDSGTIDAVLADVRMSGGSGLQIVRHIRDQNRPAPPAIILHTAFQDLSLENAYELGVDAILQKPTPSPTIIAAIRHFIVRRREAQACALQDEMRKRAELILVNFRRKQVLRTREFMVSLPDDLWNIAEEQATADGAKDLNDYIQMLVLRSLRRRKPRDDEG